jgi:hypothetical protein
VGALIAALGMGGGAAAAGAATGGFGLGSALSLGGTILSGIGQISAANNQAAALEYQAESDRIQAQQEKASAEREAAEERRQGRLLMSRARAVGATSGGGMDYDILGDLGSETEYRSLMALWGGEERARGRRESAAARTLEAKSVRSAGKIAGFGTILTGGARWANRYAPT